MFLIRHITIYSTLLFGFSGALFPFPFTTSSALAADNVPLSIKIIAGDYTETLAAPDFSSWFRLETALSVNPSQKRSEIQNTTYCPEKLWYCEFSFSRFSRERITVSLVRVTEEDTIKSFIAGLGARVNQEPSDALFGIGDNNQITVAVEEKLGRRLEEKESVAIILRALLAENTNNLSLSLELPTETIKPAISGSDRERLGLKELVGEGRTNFKGSPKNRVYNIKRALEQFQNVIIAPGEEFSFVDALGEVDGEHGYLPELVIKNNQTMPEFGGGICQVSTTVFRAAIYSGLKLTERRNHAYPVQYYKPYGMDATIYIPKPDLKFVNNTPGYILIQSIIEGDNLTFRFFGTKDGRVVSVDGPHILERGDDGSMKTVFTQEVNDSNGKNFIRDSFWSNYKSPALFPHPGQEPVYTSKPAGWSEKQWKEYKDLRS